MAFVNLSLIFGGLLLAIPIVLHLIMRPQPKHLVFPALRFVKARRDANRRQLQLRHWLLLLLRCLAIAVLATALARPSVPSASLGNWIIVGILGAIFLLAGLLTVLALVQRRGRLVTGGFGAASLLLLIAVGVTLSVALGASDQALLGSREAPVGAVVVFDSSPRMQYVWQNKSRLDEAREIALWLLRQLPRDSEVAVLDTRPRGVRPTFAVDVASAQRSVERMEIGYACAPLPHVLDEALQLAASSTRGRKEVYLVTDLTRPGWPAESPALLQQRLEATKNVALHVVDVGCPQPQNFALGDVQLSAQTLPKSGTLQVRSSVDGLGTGGTRKVELYLEPPDPERPFLQDGKTVLPAGRLRSQELVDLPENGSQMVDFQVSNLERGVHQGYLTLAGQDSLPSDNTRYFTVEVQDALAVLVAAPSGTATAFLTQAVAPHEFRQTGRAKYECTVIDQAELAGAGLDEYAAVCLLDPGPLTPPDWEKLATYVRGGGGLAVFLGHNAATASFNVPAATALLGGKLARQYRSEGDLYLAPRNYNHPIATAFREGSTSVPWNRFPVFRHWVLDDFSPDAQLIIPYSNNKPAIVETPLGQGRTLVMTTPISDPLRPRGRPAWNELPTGDNAWPYVVLVNEMLRYLADTGSTKLNYLAGETAVLPNRRDRDPDRYLLFTPLDQPQEVTATANKVVVKFTEYPGAYRLKGHRGGPVVRGFCVNLTRAASDLTRLSRSDLDRVLGADRYHFARNTDEIQLGVGEARMGREFFPLLILLVAIVLAFEQLLANRFYRSGE